MDKGISINLHTEDVLNRLRKASTERIGAAMGALRVNISEQMAASDRGRTYDWRTVDGRRVKRVHPHTSSAPGDYPGIDTGHLIQNIETDVGNYKGRIGTNVSYGKSLEYGTSRVRPRPWLKRGIDDFVDDFIQILLKEWK